MHKPQFGQQETTFVKNNEVKSSNNTNDQSKDTFSLFIKQHPAPQNLINLKPIKLERHAGFEKNYAWSLFKEALSQRTQPALKFPSTQAFLNNEDNTEDYILCVEMFIQIHADKFTLNTKQTYTFLQGCQSPQSKQ
jgi:hypothetical protein